MPSIRTMHNINLRHPPYSPGRRVRHHHSAPSPRRLEEAMGTTVVAGKHLRCRRRPGRRRASFARRPPDGYTIGIFNIPGFTVNEVTGVDQGFEMSDG